MASRPRTGRGTTVRDGSKDIDLEAASADIISRIQDGLKKADEEHKKCAALSNEIKDLEQEIADEGAKPTLAQHRSLDQLYRDLLKHSEEEKKVQEDYSLIDNLAILSAMKTSDEPASRNGAPPKSRGKPKPSAVDSDAVPDSPGPSPNESRSDLLKRVKGTGQRSSSVASARSGVVPKVEEGTETNRGVIAEKAGLLVVDAEVFYKFPKGSPQDGGAGIQCIIKKVWLDRKPIGYDVQDPEPDNSGKNHLHKATARDLIPIPQAGSQLPTFAAGAIVLARYPETDTFYKAKVRNFAKGKYTLKFEGEEEDNKEMEVDKRYVLDSKLPK